MKHYIKLCIFTFIAIIIHGYQFAVSDQEIFIPYILKSINPSLFPGDALFSQSSAYLSLFYPAVGFLIKFIDIQILFFAGYLIFQFVFFAGIHRLAKILLKSAQLAYFSLIPFLLPKFIAGTANYTYDIFFGYRSVGLVFLIFYLIYLFKKKYFKAAAIAAIGFWFHPLSIVPYIFLMPVLILADHRPFERMKVLYRSFAVFVLLISPFIVFTKIDMVSDFSNFFSANWWSIIKSRDDYLFVSTWSITAWAALGIYLVLIALFYKKLVRKDQQTLKWIIVTSFFIFLFNVSVLDVLKIPAIAQFQLVRTIAPLAYIGLALSPLLFTYKNKILKFTGALTFLFLSLNLFYHFLFALMIFSISIFITKDNNVTKLPKSSFMFTCIFIVIIYLILNFKQYLNLQEKLQFPKKENDWISLQRWVNKNTDISDKFIVPPDSTGFRIFSQRPIVGDIKDGAVVIYNNEFAQKWNYFMKNTYNYNSLSDEDASRLKEKYSFDLLIVKNNILMNFKKIYENNTYTIYKI